MNENKVPTYGAVISSMDYDVKLKRRLWFRKHGATVVASCAVLALAILVVVAFTLI